MKLICIECQKEFEDKEVEVKDKGTITIKTITAREQAWQHENPRLSKDSTVHVPSKRHVVFPITGRGA